MTGIRYPGRMVTGLQSDTTVHLGTYFGTLAKSLRGQALYPRNNFVFIADRHTLVDALTDPNPETRHFGLIRDFHALGFDPLHTIFYRQSDVPELLGLMWLLCCATSSEELESDTSHKQKHELTVGDRLYPLLMSADILGTRASWVAVGSDEEPRVAFAQRMAGNINEKCSRGVLPHPKRFVANDIDVLGIDGKRMSRQASNYVPIFGKEDDVRRRFRAITIKTTKRKDPINPTTDTCFHMYSLMSTTEDTELLRKAYLDNDVDVDDARELVSETFLEYFGEARELRTSLDAVMTDASVAEILFDGQARARRELRETLALLAEHGLGGKIDKAGGILEH